MKNKIFKAVDSKAVECDNKQRLVWLNIYHYKNVPFDYRIAIEDFRPDGRETRNGGKPIATMVTRILLTPETRERAFEVAGNLVEAVLRDTKAMGGFAARRINHQGRWIDVSSWITERNFAELVVRILSDICFEVSEFSDEFEVLDDDIDIQSLIDRGLILTEEGDEDE